jgi:hypothetical protein
MVANECEVNDDGSEWLRMLENNRKSLEMSESFFPLITDCRQSLATNISAFPP